MAHAARSILAPCHGLGYGALRYLSQPSMKPPRLVAGAFALAIGTILVAAPAAAVNLNMRDVPVGDPDRTAISFLNAHDVVYGYPDGMFRPDANVSRAELVKIVLEAAGDGHAALTGATGNAAVYTDVPPTHTLAPYVLLAASRGNISGYGDGSFRPDALVTRAEAAKIIANVLGAPAAAGSPYTDIGSSSLKPFIERLYAANWFQPAAPLFNPNIPALRREIARMAYRAIVASAASPERKYTDDLAEPEVIAADWELYEEPFLFVAPAGWEAYATTMTQDGIEVTAAAVSPREIVNEDSDAAFVLALVDADSLDDLPDAGTSGPVPMERNIALDIDGEQRTVKVLQFADPAAGRVIAWLSPSGMYFAAYDETTFPGLGGAFDRFVQHALETTDAISLDTTTPPPFLSP